MEGYESAEQLKERIMEAASKLEHRSGAHAFAKSELARELGMDDPPRQRLLSTVVNQLVNEGRLMRYPGLSKPLSIGNR